MRRIVWLVLALALVLPLGACGSGGGGGGFFGGTLEVCNDSSDFGEAIDGIEVFDQETGETFIYDIFLFPGECDIVDDFLPGFYDVTVFWTDFTFTDFFDVFIGDGDFVTLFPANG